MCMCGDYCCNSCGPAQGNAKCYVCLKWDSEGGCTTPVECGLKIMSANYVEKMIELIESEYDDNILTKDETKRLTAYRIMRKNFNRRPNITFSAQVIELYNYLAGV